MPNNKTFWGAVCALVFVLTFNRATAAATLTTDKPDYSPGTTATITGSGFAAGEPVIVQVLRADGADADYDLDHVPWSVIADTNGDFVTTWHVCEDDCVNAALVASAVGTLSGATAAANFSDSGGTGVIYVSALGNSCLAFTAAHSGGPDIWEVAGGSGYLITVSNVTECAGNEITLFVQNSLAGNFCFNASKVAPGIYSGTFAMPNPACGTSPISYKCGAGAPCNNSGALAARGPAGANTVHFRASTFDSNCARISEVTDCALPCPPSQIVDCQNNGAIVNYPVPPGTSASPPSGSLFPVGTSVVTVTGYNNATCTFTVTVRKNCVPSPCVPQSIIFSGCPNPDGGVFQCRADVPLATNIFVSAIDDCGAACSITFSETQSNPNSACSNVITRIWQARSGAVTASCTQTILINDTTPPVITITATPDDGVLSCNPTAAQIEAALGSATAIDDCSTATVSVSDSAVAVSGCSRSQTRTWTATDACGNTAAPVSRTVTWTVDATAPVITATGTPANGVLGCNPSPAQIEAALGSATAIDNCSTATVSASDTAVAVNGCVRLQTRTWTATDACGNTAAPVSRTVTWTVDTTAPVITATGTPANGVLGCNPSPAQIEAALGSATAIDDCSTATVSASDSAVVANGCSRSQTRTWTATDACGNTAAPVSRTATWTVDTTAPVITATGTPANGVLGCNPSSAQIEAALGSATAIDNCSTATVSVSDSAVVVNGCSRSQTRTWTATDACGNTATPVSRTVTWIVNTTPPVIWCPSNVTVACGGSTDPSTTGWATATDACGAASVTYEDAVAVHCPTNANIITRTWKAIGACGLTATAIQIITVQCCAPECPPISSSIASGFNGTSISTANYVWFNANFSASGIPSSGATIQFRNSTITITSSQGNFVYAAPDGKIVFSPTASCATTTFDGSQWVTTVPIKGSDEILLSALGIKVPVDLKAANVTWNGDFSADVKGISVGWKWGAAVYTTNVTTANYNALGVKPAHTGACLYNDSNHAGTPENAEKSVTGGARGGGGSNFTGSWSGTGNVKLCQ